jgi:hypothetical protein
MAIKKVTRGCDCQLTRGWGKVVADEFIEGGDGQVSSGSASLPDPVA